MIGARSSFEPAISRKQGRNIAASANCLGADTVVLLRWQATKYEECYFLVCDAV
jgi:hypothetical protein